MIKSLIVSATASESYKLFLGNFISSACGFFIITLLTRNISVDHLGLFITALTFTQLIADLFEIGINPASLNFLSKGDRSYLKASFVLKLTTAVLVTILIFILAGPIANLIFNNQTIEPFLQASAFGAGLLMFLNWCQTILQTEKKFGWSSIVISSSNIFRLTAVSFLLLLGVKGALQNYLVFQMALSFSIILFFWKFGFKFLKFNAARDHYQKMLNFGLPIGLGFGVAAIYTRLDQIFVFSIAGQKEAAIYGLASRLIIIMVFAIVAFNSAIVVRFVSLEKERFTKYFKKTYLAVAVLVLILLITILLAPIIVPLLFGSSFVAAILPFQILTIGIIFFCLALPLHDIILYRYKKSFFSFWLSAFSLIFVLILLQILIPTYGSIGAAITMSIVYFIQLLISIIYYLRIKDLKENL